MERGLLIFRTSCAILLSILAESATAQVPVGAMPEPAAVPTLVGTGTSFTGTSGSRKAPAPKKEERHPSAQFISSHVARILRTTENQNWPKVPKGTPFPFGNGVP